MPLRAQAGTTLVLLSILRSSRPFVPAAPTLLRRKLSLSLLCDGLYGPTNERPLITPPGGPAATPVSSRAGSGFARKSRTLGKIGVVGGLHSSATRLLAVPVVSSSRAVDHKSISGSLDTIHQVRTQAAIIAEQRIHAFQGRLVLSRGEFIF